MKNQWRFSVFLHGATVGYCLQLEMTQIIFWKTFTFVVLGSKQARNEVFQVLWGIYPWKFLIYVYEIDAL